MGRRVGGGRRPGAGDDADPASAAAFAALSQDLLADRDEQATLRRICARALEIVPGADLCGITVRRRRGRLATLAHTDPLAAWCDRLQYELGEGPCVDSATEGESFLVPAIAADPRWPAWAEQVEDAGVRGLVSVQLPAPAGLARHEPLGAINLYARRRHVLGERELERARVFGVHAGNAFAAARTVSSLEQAVEGRHRIGVAQGILIARYGLDVERAFDLLERYASSLGVKVRDVAAEVLARGDLPPVAGSIPDGMGPAG